MCINCVKGSSKFFSWGKNAYSLRGSEYYWWFLVGRFLMVWSPARWFLQYINGRRAIRLYLGPLQLLYERW